MKLIKCGYCGKEIQEHHPKMLYSQVRIAENPKKDRIIDRPVCQDCARDIISDMASRYKPGKLYIE